MPCMCRELHVQCFKWSAALPANNNASCDYVNSDPVRTSLLNALQRGPRALDTESGLPGETALHSVTAATIAGLRAALHVGSAGDCVPHMTPINPTRAYLTGSCRDVLAAHCCVTPNDVHG